MNANTLPALCCLFTIALVSETLIAQSSDPDAPTLLQSKTIKGEHSSGLNDESVHYYTFNVEPGTLTLTLDIKPINKSDAGGFLSWTLMDTKFQTLKTDVLSAQGSADRQVTDMPVTKKRQVILKSEVSGTMTYKIKLEGPVRFIKGKTRKSD